MVMVKIQSLYMARMTAMTSPPKTRFPIPRAMLRFPLANLDEMEISG
jgi:hypothetical protein